MSEVFRDEPDQSEEHKARVEAYWAAKRAQHTEYVKTMLREHAHSLRMENTEKEKCQDGLRGSDAPLHVYVPKSAPVDDDEMQLHVNLPVEGKILMSKVVEHQ